MVYKAYVLLHRTVYAVYSTRTSRVQTQPDAHPIELTTQVYTICPTCPPHSPVYMYIDTRPRGLYDMLYPSYSKFYIYLYI